MQKIGHFLAVAGGGAPGNSSNSDLGNTPFGYDPDFIQLRQSISKPPREKVSKKS